MTRFLLIYYVDVSYERTVYEFCSTLGTDSYNGDSLTDTLELKLRWIQNGDPIFHTACKQHYSARILQLESRTLDQPASGNSVSKKLIGRLLGRLDPDQCRM